MRVGKKNTQDHTLELPMLIESEPIGRSGFLRSASDTEIDEHVTNSAIPFVKWVGGKRSIIVHLKKRLPQEFNAYHEPFVGGGALFFEIHRRISSAYLSDSNLDLLLGYSVIKREPQKLIARLKRHAQAHCEDYYYKMRSQHCLQDAVEIAARFLYLNRTCYNGLYRVNKKGEFNVPVGDYENPGIVQEENILLCSRALQKNVTIAYKDFSEIQPSTGDFVYFDPPYHPTDESSFTAYSKNDFTEKDQARLAVLAKVLHERGVKVMLSNSNTKLIRHLFRSPVFRIEIVSAPRMVNCKPNGRGAVEEVLITNY